MNMIRRAADSDITTIIECIKECFGADYYHPAAYDRDFLTRSNTDGSYRLYVCCDDNDPEQVVGIMGARKSPFFPDSTELSMEAIRPAYRRMGYGERLFRFVLEQCGGNVYAHAVTHSSIIHDQVIKSDVLPTGMWYGRYRSQRSFLPSRKDRRLHSVIIVKACSPCAVHDIYAPQEHVEFITRIYESLRVPVTIVPCICTEISGDEEKILFSKEDSCCDIYVQQSGKKSIDRIIGIVEEAKIDSVDFNIFLNMKDRNFGYLYSFFCENGYFFTGIHPLHGSCEYCVLHRKSIIYSESMKLNKQVEEIFNYIGVGNDKKIN